MSEKFTARVTSGHKVMVPKECRERLSLKPRQLCRVTLTHEESWQNLQSLQNCTPAGSSRYPPRSTRRTS